MSSAKILADKVFKRLKYLCEYSIQSATWDEATWTLRITVNYMNQLYYTELKITPELSSFPTSDTIKYLSDRLLWHIEEQIKEDA